MFVSCAPRHFQQLPFYEKLTDRMYQRNLFLDYNHEIALRNPGQVIGEQQEQPVTGTALTDNVYYYLDLSYICDEYEAAKQLVQVMLDYYASLPEEKITFRILKTEIPEQKLYSFRGMVELHAQRCTELTAGMEEEEAYAAIDQYLNAMLAGGWQESMDFLALGPDMWIFDPLVTFDYEGICNGYAREECEAYGLAAENGLVTEAQQGSSGMYQYLLIRQGNLWRMQRIGKILELNEVDLLSETPLQPAEPPAPVENPSVEEQPESPEDGPVSVDRENWGPPETDQPDPDVTEEDGQALAALLASLPYTDEVCEGLHDYTVIAGGNTYYICLNCCAVVLGDRQANLTEAQLAEILSCLN